MRFAWWGRVSTDDQQDPTLSLPRQLHASRAALPADAVIVAHYYDVESGRKDLEARGLGSAHEDFDIPIPRDGGIRELLSEAQAPDRRFDAVICESIERIARRTYYRTKIEHELETAGVALFASDEPIILSGKRATAILTRRVKQGVAEWYVLEMLEKSWDGFCEHTRQGWNVGVPPYGYLAEKIPHPVPSKRAEGATKTRLVPDPLRAPVVHQIFAWRVLQRLSYTDIRDRLNPDLERSPPPECPDSARTRGEWTKSAVYHITRNPKYTGHMVWNCRASKKGGKVNSPDKWVWSPSPTHEPIVTKEMFEAAQSMGDEKRGSRGSGTNRHPQTKRSYVLRSFVFCDLCERRMFGRTRRKHAYYTCQPHINWGKEALPEKFPGHPPTTYVREDRLVNAVIQFIGERLFGAERRQFLESELSRRRTRKPAQDRAKRARELNRALGDLERKQARMVRALEADDDPTGILFRQVRDRLNELELERRAKAEELATLSQAADPVELGPEALEVLDTLRRSMPRSWGR